MSTWNECIARNVKKKKRKKERKKNPGVSESSLGLQCDRHYPEK